MEVVEEISAFEIVEIDSSNVDDNRSKNSKKMDKWVMNKLRAFYEELLNRVHGLCSISNFVTEITKSLISNLNY